MNAATGVFLVLLALALANLPFLSQRIFWVVRANGAKAFGWYLLELVLMYFVVGAAAFGLEARSGQVYAQGWEFYAMTACFFLVLAFPGFVWRYLWKHGRSGE